MSTMPIRHGHGEHNLGFTLGKVLAIVLGAMLILALGAVARGTLGPSNAAEMSSFLGR